MAGTEERTNFVILFQGRAGSSFLVDALGRHPDVVAAGELLADLVPEVGSRPHTFLERLRAGLGRFRKGCPVVQQGEITRHFYDDVRTSGRAVGFKVKVRDVLNLQEMKIILEERGVRAIILDRSNLVKQAVSRLNAQRLHEATNEWNLHDPRSRPRPFEVGPGEFDRTLRRVIFDQRMLSAFAEYLDVPKMRLEYADLLLNREGWLESVTRFLDVEPCSLDSGVLKNTDDDLRKVLINFEELKDSYRGTEFETMFEV